MRIALISDIRGNLCALKAVLEKLEAKKPERLIVFGEVFGFGPAPKKILETLAPHSPLMIWGSGDLSLLADPRWARRVKKALGNVSWHRPEEIEIDGVVIQICWEEGAQLERPIVLMGGGGQPGMQQLDGHLVINPGSVGSPSEVRATCALFDVEEQNVEIIESSYSLERALAVGRKAKKKGRYPKSLLRVFERSLLGAPTKGGAVTPQMSGTTLASHVLLRRIRKVYWPISTANWPADDVDLVHDVRVATRRLTEALFLMRPVIGRAKKVRRRLGELRRALGPCRMLDVLMDLFRVDRQKHGIDHETTTQMVEILASQRVKETPEFHAAYSQKKLLQEGFDALALINNVEDGATFAEVAFPAFENRLERFEHNLKIARETKSGEAYHTLRVAGKRLRYTSEMMMEAYPDGLWSEALAELKQFQDHFGELRDAQDLLELLDQRLIRSQVEAERISTLREQLKLVEASRYEIATKNLEEIGPQVVDRFRSRQQP